MSMSEVGRTFIMRDAPFGTDSHPSCCLGTDSTPPLDDPDRRVMPTDLASSAGAQEDPARFVSEIHESDN